MSLSYRTWREAHASALRLAQETHAPVSIRQGVEWGRPVYRVSLACLADADPGEIVRPGDPSVPEDRP